MSKKRLVYVAHPMSGDIDGNTEKVKKIIRFLTEKEKKRVADLERRGFQYQERLFVAPYLASIAVFDDRIPKERVWGTEINERMINNQAFNDLWLFGDRYTEGMHREVRLAKIKNISIAAISKGVNRDYFKSYIQQQGGICAEVYLPGDESVGIFSTTLKVETGIPSTEDLNDIDRVWLRRKYEDLYSEMNDVSPRVSFSDECPECEEVTPFYNACNNPLCIDYIENKEWYDKELQDL